jgi:hypothetical protein
VYDTYAYVTDMNSDHIEIFNIASVSNPFSAASYTFPTGISGGNNISTIGRYAFISVFTGAVLILDLTEPAAPAEIGRISTDAATGLGISFHAVSGNYLYGTNYTTGKLLVIDLIPEG